MSCKEGDTQYDRLWVTAKSIWDPRALRQLVWFLVENSYLVISGFQVQSSSNPSSMPRIFFDQSFLALNSPR